MKKVVKAILVVSLAIVVSANVCAKSNSSQSGTITVMHEKNGG